MASGAAGLATSGVFRRGMAQTLAANMAVKGASFLAFLALPVFLVPEQIGAYYGASFLGAIFSAISISSAGDALIAGEEREGRGSLYVWGGAAYCVLLALAFAATAAHLHPGDRDFLAVAAVLAAFMPLNPFFSYRMSMLYRGGDFRSPAMGGIAVTATQSVVTVAAIALLRSPLGVALGGAAGALAGLLYAWARHPALPAPSVRGWPAAASAFASLIGAGFLQAMCAPVALLLAGRALGAAEFGVLSFAYTLASQWHYLSAASLRSLLVRAEDGGGAGRGGVATAVLAMGMAGYALLALAAVALLHAPLPAKWQDLPWSLFWLAIAFIPQSVVVLRTARLVAAERYRLLRVLYALQFAAAVGPVLAATWLGRTDLPTLRLALAAGILLSAAPFALAGRGAATGGR